MSRESIKDIAFRNVASYTIFTIYVVLIYDIC